MSFRRDASWALGALGLLVLWDRTPLDLAAAHLYGTAAGFALRDHWLTRTVVHEGGRALGWIVLALLLVRVVVPSSVGPARAERVRWLLVTLACLLLVPALKLASATSCPWDLADFGGTARYVPHWMLGVRDGGSGHCFPSGHAVAAFAFFSVYFMERHHRPQLARRWLAGVLVVGLLFGWAQLARGAHYPSHTMWSAWLCWVVCSVAAWRAPRPRPAVTLSTAPDPGSGAP